MTDPPQFAYRGQVRRQVGVLASHGARPGALVPPWIYRAVAYDPDDPFRQPVWMCSHNHGNPQDAQLCGADWARDEGKSATALSD